MLHDLAKKGLDAQDWCALAICTASLLWLLHRLVLRYLPAEKKPHVTTAQLVRRSRQRRDCH